MASKRHQRRKACQGKRAFATSAEAGKQAGKETQVYGEYLTVYHCQFCGQFHFGHPPKNIRNILRSKGVIA